MHLIDREPLMRALPLSNPWLAGFTPERLPPIDLAAWAARRGQRFTAGMATALDRGKREVSVVSADGGTARVRYDFLLLAGGAVPDHAAWFGGDEAAATAAREKFPAGFVASELDAVQRALLRSAAARS
ncbi:MAG: hypothetical protein U1F25_06050 [Rubrivivax sp.]